MQLNYLVTGCGRSGTVFMARLLTSLGIKCSHEMIFDYRGIDYAILRMSGKEPLQLSWVSRAKYNDGKWEEHNLWLDNLEEVVAESSYMVAPFLGEDCIKNAKVIHVVRDPIKVVNSYCNYIEFYKNSIAENSYEDFVYSHIPELKQDMPQYDRAVLFWIRWNQMIERKTPHYFHRIEEDVSGVMSFLGVDGLPFNDKTINTFKKPVKDIFSIEKINSKLLRNEFIEMGRKYGYSMKSNQVMFI